jgi:SAM-dependent methyltransferase
MEQKSENLKQKIRETYTEHAKRAQKTTQPTSQTSCCGPSVSACGCGSSQVGSYAKSIGYSNEELNDLPDNTVAAAAGCGNPTAIAGLNEGEVVLDLGSGGGLDAFIAAQIVGPSGKVIGVDMTDEMLNVARNSAEEMGIKNVEFRKGDIEDLPVEDQTVDVVISNCVINLAPDKDKVFREAYRVLKPGGRFSVSDIVTEGDLPEGVKDNPDEWASCVAGAIDGGSYMEKLKTAGFKDVKELARRGFGAVYSVEVEGTKPQ